MVGLYPTNCLMCFLRHLQLHLDLSTFDQIIQEKVLFFFFCCGSITVCRCTNGNNDPQKKKWINTGLWCKRSFIKLVKWQKYTETQEFRKTRSAQCCWQSVSHSYTSVTPGLYLWWTLFRGFLCIIYDLRGDVGCGATVFLETWTDNTARVTYTLYLVQFLYCYKTMITLNAN